MVTRKELYEAVWTEPLLKLAERFEVSDSYLARVCDSLRVPRPDRGYWAKKEAGKAPPKPALPQAESGDPIDWAPGVLIKRSSPRNEPLQAGNAKRKTTHALLNGAAGHFAHSRKSEEGYLKPYKRNLADITVSEASLQSALLFANNLFLALEGKGHRVCIFNGQDGSLRRPDVDPLDEPRSRGNYSPHHGLWRPGRLTVVYVGGQTIGLSIVETAKQMLMRYIGNGTYVPEADYVERRSSSSSYSTWTTTKEKPSGSLRLIAYAPHYRVELTRVWRESSKTSSSNLLRDIVSGIEAMAVEMVELVASAERQAEAERRKWEEQLRRSQIEENKRRIEGSVKDSREQLDQIIRYWAETKARLEFLAELELELSTLQEPHRSDLISRVELARKLLGSTDALAHFKEWRAPGERYSPKRFDEDESCPGLIS